MKKVLFITALLISTSSFCQDYDASMNTLTKNSWGVGKTKSLFGHKIERVAGAGGFFSKTITNIGFEDSKRLISDARTKAIKEMWTEEKLKSTISSYEKISGYLHIYIVRNTIESANTKWLTVIVKDIDGNEIGRTRCADEIADFSNYDPSVWYNFDLIPLVNVHAPFFVYIIDEISEPAQHCFKILN